MRFLKWFLAGPKWPARGSAAAGPVRGSEGVDRAEVRRLYEAGEVPVSAIRAAHGLTEHGLRKAYDEGGWRRRRQVAVPSPAQGRHSVLDPDAVARRLFRQMSAKVRRLHPTTQAELQALAAFVRALEGVMREDRLRRQGGPDGAVEDTGDNRSSTPPAAGGGHSPTDDDDTAHVEWMRSELKRRLRVLAGDEPAGTREPDRPDGGAGA